MTKITNIINSKFEPPINTLWLNGGKARYYDNGKWITVGIETEEGILELESKVDSLDKELGKVNSKIKNIIGVPSGGVNGQVLKKTVDGYSWADDDNTLYENASTTTSGLMSKDDKAKLDNLNNYVLPPATKNSLGGIKAGTNIASLPSETTLPTIIGTINSILSQLKSCGILIP